VTRCDPREDAVPGREGAVPGRALPWDPGGMPPELNKLPWPTCEEAVPGRQSDAMCVRLTDDSSMRSPGDMAATDIALVPPPSVDGVYARRALGVDGVYARRALGARARGVRGTWGARGARGVRGLVGGVDAAAGGAGAGLEVMLPRPPAPTLSPPRRSPL
jgi:hypothetical protein